MTIQEMIDALTFIKETEGNLNINLSTNKKQDVSDIIFLRIEKYDDQHLELSISDFPY